MKVVLYGGFGVPNFGDEAILAANLDFYETHFPDAQVFIATANASYTAMVHHDRTLRTIPSNFLSSFVNQEAQKALVQAGDVAGLIQRLEDQPLGDVGNTSRALICRFLADIDVLHITGGGYFGSAFRGVPTTIALLTELARRNGARVLFTGHTLGPISDEHADMVVNALQQAELIDIRDERGRDFLSKHDLKFNLTCDDVFVSNRWWTAPRQARLGERAYVNLMISGEGIREGQQPALQLRIRDLAKQILERWPELSVRFLCFCPPGRDFLLPLAVGQDLPEFRKRLEFVELSSLPINQAMDVLGDAVANIGSRFHLAVLSCARGVPLFSLHHDISQDRLFAFHQQIGSTNIAALRTFEVGNVLDFVANALKRTGGSADAEVTATRARLHALKLNTLLNCLIGAKLAEPSPPTAGDAPKLSESVERSAQK